MYNPSYSAVLRAAGSWHGAPKTQQYEELSPSTAITANHTSCNIAYMECEMSYRSSANTRTIIIHICRTMLMLLRA